MTTCVFCTDVRESGDVIYDDDRVWVVLHADWAVAGHAMVVWKQHVENISDLDPTDALHFSAVAHRAERAILAATRAGRAILLKLGIATPHLHLHVYPVAATLDRDSVFAIIDNRVRAPYDAELVAELRERLAS
jgi:diadenosine tetraphosphate (Ap4A) HIT family hydrolase